MAAGTVGTVDGATLGAGGMTGEALEAGEITGAGDGLTLATGAAVGAGGVAPCTALAASAAAPEITAGGVNNMGTIEGMLARTSLAGFSVGTSFSSVASTTVASEGRRDCDTRRGCCSGSTIAT